MRATSETIELSASDLSQFLGCHHRTALDLQVARALRPAPSWDRVGAGVVDDLLAREADERRTAGAIASATPAGRLSYDEGAG